MVWLSHGSFYSYFFNGFQFTAFMEKVWAIAYKNRWKKLLHSFCSCNFQQFNFRIRVPQNSCIIPLKLHLYNFYLKKKLMSFLEMLSQIWTIHHNWQCSWCYECEISVLVSKSYVIQSKEIFILCFVPHECMNNFNDFFLLR